jgi:hypothetical protein
MQHAPERDRRKNVVRRGEYGRADGEVYLVDPVVHVPMDTDVGPLLIGA